MAHTPGPWEISRNFEIWPEDKTGKMVRKISSVIRTTTDSPTDVNRMVVEASDEVAKANARLIAAAPLMKLFVDNASACGDNMATLIKEVADGKREMSDVWSKLHEAQTAA